jgi:hypothetical protein
MLYLILPYFNFTESIFAKKNLDLFINNYAKRANLRIVLCEGIYNEELPDYSGKIYKHLKFKLKNILWVKENLINIAIKNLPEDAQYIAWSDRDILFLNASWVEETIEKLKVYDIVQPWSEVIHLNSLNELQILLRKNCMAFSSKSIIASAIENNNVKGSSTGQIWAINKLFYDKIKKINDIEIIGGADSIIANFCILKNDSYEKTLNRKTTIESRLNWIKYKEKFKDVKYSYINGAIIHYWHGDLENRKYTERSNILIDLNYDPNNDITYDENGVLQFTEDGKRIEPFIKEYFFSRKENNTSPNTENNHIFSIPYVLQTCLVPIYAKNYED